MPQLNGTGPLGKGPLTGRGMGLCVVEMPREKDAMPRQDDVGGDGYNALALRGKLKEVMTMPAGDGTGPLGFGPMTGRAAGYCAGYPTPGYANAILGRPWGQWGGYWGQNYPLVTVPYGYGIPAFPGWPRGFGRGRGRGFGRGRGRGRWSWGW